MSKKSEKILSIYDVWAIKKSANPAQPFAPGIVFEDLTEKNYHEIVEIFNERISRWYFDIGEQIHQKIPDCNFALIIFCSIILDLLSQYVYAVPTSSESVFKKFFRQYLSKWNFEVSPPIVSCYYHKRRITGSTHLRFPLILTAG